MDRDHHELQLLGLFGIFRESFKIIFSWRKIFSKITLTLILPLSAIYLAHSLISQLIFFNILHLEFALGDTSFNTPKYSKISDVISAQWAAFWLFKLGYFTFLLIFSLLSTSAVVYTIACIYTAKEITYRKVMSVVPKVWKRLIVTFLWSFGIVFLYNIIAFGVFLLWVVSIAYSVIGLVVGIVLLISYFSGLVYISLIWNMASVVSVLEDVYGRKAMSKARNLLKGKMGVAVGMFLVVIVCFVAVESLFENFVVIDVFSNLGARIGFGIICLLLLLKVILLQLVLQTVIYFVCKAYHHENIDKSTLSDHLEVYLGDYVRLNPSRDVQLEQIHV